MPTSSARPDHLHRYSMVMTDRSAAARAVGTRATVALSAYRASCPDLPVTVDAPTLADGALARSEAVVARVRRVAAAFVLADHATGSVHAGGDLVVVGDERFGQLVPGAITAIGEEEPDILYRGGWGLADSGTHTIGPADLSGSYEVLVGAEVTRTSFFDFDKNGLDAALGYAAFVGARSTADGTLEAGVLSGRGSVEASVGAEASLDANARISLDEIHADVSGGGYIGGKASLNGELEAMGVGYEGGVEARYGIGADFEAEAHFGWDEISLGASGGLAAGLGFGGRGGISVNPKETVSDAVRIGARLPGDVKKGVEVVEARAEDLIVDGIDMAGDAYRGGRDVFDDGLEFARNPLGNVGSFGSATIKPPPIADILEGAGRQHG